MTELSKVFAASSLWCTYSKLKTILRVREKVDVSSFTNIVSFLKKMSVRHVPRKSNVLSRSQIDEFLLNAPDDVFLLIKVVIAFGVFGAYRRQELHDLCFNDVKVEGSVLVSGGEKRDLFCRQWHRIVFNKAVEKRIRRLCIKILLLIGNNNDIQHLTLHIVESEKIVGIEDKEATVKFDVQHSEILGMEAERKRRRRRFYTHDDDLECDTETEPFVFTSAEQFQKAKDPFFISKYPVSILTLRWEI
ncbi:hypothetical protein C0J52_17470 [Blattella germanica]|nr:hypothetical protein C0J52_17470 [Blattella germanica]